MDSQLSVAELQALFVSFLTSRGRQALVQQTCAHRPVNASDYRENGRQLWGQRQPRLQWGGPRVCVLPTLRCGPISRGGGGASDWCPALPSSPLCLGHQPSITAGQWSCTRRPTTQGRAGNLLTVDLPNGSCMIQPIWYTGYAFLSDLVFPRGQWMYYRWSVRLAR